MVRGGRMFPDDDDDDRYYSPVDEQERVFLDIGKGLQMDRWAEIDLSDHWLYNVYTPFGMILGLWTMRG